VKWMPWRDNAIDVLLLFVLENVIIIKQKIDIFYYFVEITMPRLTPAMHFRLRAP